MNNKRLMWARRVEELGPGHSYRSAATLLGYPYATVRRWMKVLKYKPLDGRVAGGAMRTHRAMTKYRRLDWSKPISVLCAEVNISRQRMHIIRDRLSPRK